MSQSCRGCYPSALRSGTAMQVVHSALGLVRSPLMTTGQCTSLLACSPSSITCLCKCRLCCRHAGAVPHVGAVGYHPSCAQGNH